MLEKLKLNEIDWVKLSQEPKSWLLGLTVALAGLHLTILDRSGQPNLMSVSMLMWLTIASLLWDKREHLLVKSNLFATCLGATLIFLVLLRSISPAGYQVRVSPLISSVGLVLMAGGIKGLRYYWKELFILTLLALYSFFDALLNLMKLPLITAKFGNFSLLLLGFDTYRDGVYLHLPTGSVEVSDACSGIESIILMFYVACLFFLLIPISRWQKLLCIAVAIFLGFITNSFRVALMAWLVAYSDQEAFNYWHGDDGSLVFAIISVGMFGIFCWLAYVRDLTLAPDIEEES